jgi:flagellar motility protein MotE (MotC chaperone)
MAMRFVFKIAGYTTLAVINLLIYIAVFATAIGMKPDTGMEYLKYKLSNPGPDSLTTAEQIAELPLELRMEFDKAEQHINDEKNMVKNQRDSLNLELQKLEAVRDEIQNLLAARADVNEGKLNDLAKIYDGMDQERLVEVFNQLEDSLIAAILPRMKSANASLVLEFMQPDRSARI